MKKVLVISNMYPSDKHPSFGSFVHEQVEQLRKKNIEVLLSVSKQKEGTKIQKLKKYFLLFLHSFFFSFSKKVSIIHLHFVFPTGLILLPISFLTRKKIVVTAHGSDVIGASKFKKKMLKKIFKISNEIIAVSSFIKSEIESLGIDSSKIHVINCGVDQNLFFPNNKNQAKEKLNLNKDKKHVLFLGNVLDVKGIFTFCEVVKKSINRSDIHFSIVGDGPAKEKAKKILTNYSNVSFYPAIPKKEVPNWFNASDVFIFPTKKEAFGLVALESLACNTPVIASNVGGVPETIENENNGFLVHPDDSDEFYEKMMVLIDNKKVYQEFVSRCFMAPQKFSINKQTGALLDIYQKLSN